MRILYKFWSIGDHKARFALLFLVLLAVVGILVPLIPGLDPNQFNPSAIGLPQPPSFAHVCGTDELGRDTLLRAVHGARVSLTVGFVSVGISVGIGIIIGLISGFLGGWVDELIMRFVDLMMALPTIFLILTIQVLLKPSIFNVMVVIGVTSWMGVARMVRAEVLSVKERTFVTAARARQISVPRLVVKHILPHTVVPVIVSATLGMGSAILTESVLSYLGMGVQPPFASWGNMLSNSMDQMQTAPWLAIVPGLLITLTVLSLNFMGDALRSILNPRELTH